MTEYAKATTVSVAKSKAEIERILQRYGAKQFISGWDQQYAYVGFVINNRAIKIPIELPLKETYCETPTGMLRSPETAIKHWEQACRQKWRALVLVVKAKLEAVESGIATVENEFLAYTCLPSGETVGQWLQPQIDKVISEKEMPKLLT